MPIPELIQFEVTKAITKQIEVIDEMAKAEQPEALSALIGRMTQATGELVEAWRKYLHALNPDGWEKATEELKQLEAMGLTRSATDFAWLAEGQKT